MAGCTEGIAGTLGALRYSEWLREIEQGRRGEGERGSRYVWDGNYYALAIMERLDLQKSGGMLRVGAVHYNTLDEVARLIDVLKTMPR